MMVQRIIRELDFECRHMPASHENKIGRIEIGLKSDGFWVEPPLNIGVTLAYFQHLGNTPSLRSLLNISVIMFKIYGKVLLSIVTDMPSVPADLRSGTLLRYLITLSGVNLGKDMKVFAFLFWHTKTWPIILNAGSSEKFVANTGKMWVQWLRCKSGFNVWIFFFIHI